MCLGKPNFREGQAEKSKLEKLSFFQGNRGNCFNFALEGWKPPFYTFLTQIIIHFLYVSEHVKKTYTFDIFETLSQICTSLLPNFGVDPKFDHIPLCVYY